MLLNPFTYHAPSTAKEAAKLLSTLKDVKVLAGGTFLINNLKQLKRQCAKTPAHIISLRKIEEIKGVHATQKTLTIGSMTTINDLMHSSQLKENCAILKTVCQNIGTSQIRNMATVGGNITSRYVWTELGAAFIALDAQLRFVAPDGKNHILTTQEFFDNNAKSPGIFADTIIPINKKQKLSYRRIAKSSTVDIPLLAVCIGASYDGKRFSDARVAINSASVFTKRDSAVEDILNTSICTDDILEKISKNVSPKIYRTQNNEYKKHMLCIILKNAVLDIIAKARNYKNDYSNN